MHRALSTALVLLLLAAGCSSADDPAGATYFDDAAAISLRYESAAAIHFDAYRGALLSATAETGDAIFVEANRGLFDNLSTEFGRAVADLDGLTPPEDVVEAHRSWLDAARALNGTFADADAQLATLTDPDAVNAVVSQLPLADLQAAYRAACSEIAALAADESAAVITCDPVNGGA